MKDFLGRVRGRVLLHVVLPLPPTDNNIYFNMPGGGRALTGKAKAYKRAVASEIATLAAKSRVKFPKHVPYTLRTWVYFTQIETKGWVKGKAQNRYMKVDTGNRSKLVEDALASAIGIDDRHFFDKHHYKRCDPDDPRVEVELKEREDV